jgi:hypothetical protein
MKLNQRAYEHAQQLIADQKVVLDGRDEWSEHRPSAREENRLIAERGIEEYARWYLGIDEEQPPARKRRYKFPYGDFAAVHRCGVLAAESRAGQYKHYDVERAAAHLHGMLEVLMKTTSQPSGGSR